MTESELWLASLTATNFVELNQMLSHVLADQDRNRLVKEAIRMSKWNFNLHEWEKEKLDEIVRLESKRIDREEGIEENTKNNIKKMLEKNLDKQLISEITGKTIEEIEKIEKTN